MKVGRGSSLSQTLAWIAALTVGGAAPVASAADDWPPRTAPKVDMDAPPSPPRAAPPEPAAAPDVPAVGPEAGTASSQPPARTLPAATVGVAAQVPSTRPAPGSLAGLSEDRIYARTPGNAIVLFPGGLLQVDGRTFHTSSADVPEDRVRLGRARLELAGWLGPVIYFNAATDFASGPSLRGVDNFVALAPWTERVILQAGQFDAPFTLENRASDRGLDFMDRAAAVRMFAIPENKKRGVMVHGTTPGRNFSYAAGGFSGDGQSDVMGRGWVAPFSFVDPDVLRNITFGGSLWLGDASGSAFGRQTTPGGFVLLEPSTTWLDGTDTTDVTLRQRGRCSAFAVGLNAPIWHKMGARFEWVAKHQPLEVVSARNAGSPTAQGGLNLNGWSTYGEVWYWAIGDDHIVGEPGLQLPVRLGTLGLARPLTGLMLAARLDYLDEDLAADARVTSPADIISIGKTRLTTLTVGANAWFGRRLRATLNYAWNHLDGTSFYFTGITDSNVHELSFRMALAL
jgi:Phosphate-selective porin O and P